MRVNYVSDPAAMSAAARWLARFHAANADAASNGSFPWLKRYDAAYYLGWPRRTALFARRLHRPLGLGLVCWHLRRVEFAENLRASPI